jgi:hypothetical protein
MLGGKTLSVLLLLDPAVVEVDSSISTNPSAMRTASTMSFLLKGVKNPKLPPDTHKMGGDGP